MLEESREEKLGNINDVYEDNFSERKVTLCTG